MFNNKKTYINDLAQQLSLFDLNKLLNKDKEISSVDQSFFNNLPKEKSINNWINFRLIYFGYIFLIIGLITLSLFFSFIALYVLKNNHEAINTLIAAIVFCLIFFIGYFSLMFSYSYVMKKDFKLLKTKFEYLWNNNYLIKDFSLYPPSIEMINYEQNPSDWSNNKEILKFSYYAINISLLSLLNQLKLLIKHEK